jgi:hypothetical protein
VIYVFGGSKNCTAELYKIAVNAWTDLPALPFNPKDTFS